MAKPKTRAPFTVPATTLRLMREFTKGVIAGADHAGDITEMFEDEWIEWSTKYDINIYRDRNGDIAASVYPVLPHPTNPNLRTTDASRFIKINLN